MKEFKISISTPIGKTFEDNITQLNIEISGGRIGVYANHAPMISSIIVSKFSVIKLDGTKMEGVISSGIFNITSEEVILIPTNFVWANEVDMGYVDNEIKNIEYNLKGELTPIEEESLLNRLKFVKLQREIYIKK